MRHGPKTSGHSIGLVASNLTSGFHCVLCFIFSFLNWDVNWTVETLQSENKFMSASNINVIISRTTAIVQVQFAPWATNNTLHWLNLTPMVNWYTLKIRAHNSEIEQHLLSNLS